MTENERVRHIRDTLNLSLEKFGNRLGITRAAVSNIEKGNRSVTEQMRKAICREFNVDYIWLTTGEGEMFLQDDDSIIEIIDRVMSGESEIHKRLFKCLAYMSDEDLERLESIIKLASTHFGEDK